MALDKDSRERCRRLWERRIRDQIVNRPKEVVWARKLPGITSLASAASWVYMRHWRLRRGDEDPAVEAVRVKKELDDKGINY